MDARPRSRPQAATGFADRLLPRQRHELRSRAILSFSQAYAEQNERDYRALMKAVESGRDRGRDRVCNNAGRSRGPQSTKEQGDSAMATQPTVQNRETQNAGSSPQRRQPSSRPCTCRARDGPRLTETCSRCTIWPPSTLMFSDRPERIAGHLTTSQFVEGLGARRETASSTILPTRSSRFLGGEQEEAPEGRRGHAHQSAPRVGANHV